jgi:hypothetical protein
VSQSESLRSALSSAMSPDGDCPSPEDYLRLEAGEATPEERRRLEAHAARCQACAAERELARIFQAGPEEGEIPREDLDFVVSRLEKLRLHETPRPLEFRARKRPAIIRWAGSLAALVALAVGLSLFLQNQAPPLPEPDRGDRGEVMRGAEIHAIQPAGEFPEVPREFRWAVTEGARSYQVTLRAVDETVLWQETVAAPSARLPEEVARGLHPAVLYSWTVEALNERNERLAASEPVRFMVRPPEESPPPPSR